LKQAAQAAPNNTALLTQLANKLYDAGRFDEAVSYYEQVLALDPQNISVITDLGTAQFYLGRTDEAIARFQQSLQIDPRHVQTLHNLVVVYAQGKQDMIAAGDVLERLEAVDPANPSILQLRNMLKPGANQGKGNPRQRIF
jgi:Flp pilus assembly protein TadD